MTTLATFDRSIGCRADGTPYNVRFLVLEGKSTGATTVFVAGLFGDKPLATLALWRLAQRLCEEDELHGKVVLCPAANPFALDTGTRVSPDHLYLNRSFPGKSDGPLTGQIALEVLQTVLNESDCVVDLHSGTPQMSLWYTYDYGNLELSSSFGFTPVITGLAQPGQLSKAVVDAGGKSMLVEFGGGSLSDCEVGVNGCMNVLKYRGQLRGAISGPKKVPLIEGTDVSLYQPSTTGMLISTHPTAAVGQTINTGTIATLLCPGTGQQLEEFESKREGALLLLASASPAMMAAGDFGAAIGYPSKNITVPS